MQCDLCSVDSSYCPAIGSGVSCAGVATTPPKSALDKMYYLEMMRQKHNCARSDVAVALGRKVRVPSQSQTCRMNIIIVSMIAGIVVIYHLKMGLSSTQNRFHEGLPYRQYDD